MAWNDVKPPENYVMSAKKQYQIDENDVIMAINNVIITENGVNKTLLFQISRFLLAMLISQI